MIIFYYRRNCCTSFETGEYDANANRASTSQFPAESRSRRDYARGARTSCRHYHSETRCGSAESRSCRGRRRCHSPVSMLPSSRSNWQDLHCTSFLMRNSLSLSLWVTPLFASSITKISYLRVSFPTTVYAWLHAYTLLLTRIQIHYEYV